MERVLAEAHALGGRVLRLDSEQRLAAAVRLYRRYGFREIDDYNRNPARGRLDGAAAAGGRG
jgi:ribosomal protein S18 acetylase RimI-like enzyme